MASVTDGDTSDGGGYHQPSATPSVPSSSLFLDPDERYEVFNVKCAERPHLLHVVPPEAEAEDGRNDETSPPKGGEGGGDGGGEEEKKDGTADDDDDDVDGDDGGGRGAGGEDRGGGGGDDDCSDGAVPPPLVDGCDLPGWRRHNLAGNAISDEVRGMLNVGIGSALFRRADQLAFVVPPRRRGTGVRRRRDGWEALRDSLASTPPPERWDADVVSAGEAAELVAADDAGGGDDAGGSGAAPVPATRFALEYERRNVPAKILGCADGWEAMPTYDGGAAEEDDGPFACGGGAGGGWTFRNLLGRFGRVAWRFSDVHGEMLSLDTYAKYLTNPEGLTDDSPLAIYDAEFGDDDSPTGVLVREYGVPECFSPDLFDLAVPDEDGGAGDGGRGSRPPYRWILIGPERSGTGLHVDPLWTNAWVTVLQGRKRWVLFPPRTPPERIGMFEGRPQIPSSVWFRDYYDVVTGPDWPEAWRPVEVLQEPGETVFVPNGWAHLVLNLELTVAVTHNYASEFGPFLRMWEEVATEEPGFARRWYGGMLLRRKDLARKVWEYHQNAILSGRDWAISFGALETRKDSG